MKVAIIGNGILGLMTAYELRKRSRESEVTIVGPADNKGCASLAAAAMFNSFAEVDRGTLANRYEKQKFLFNRLSVPKWPGLLKDLSHESGETISYGFGTFVVNNHASDQLEDENFDAIVGALKELKGSYETVEPSKIPHYRPSARLRAARAMLIHDEGWVNPRDLFKALTKILTQDPKVTWTDGYGRALKRGNAGIEHLELEDGRKITGDQFLLVPGATFSKIIAASNLELNLPKIFYGLGCSVLLRTKENTLSQCVRTPNRGLACGVYAAPHSSEDTLIGASNFISPVPEDFVRTTSVYTLLKSAMEQINSDYYRAGLVRVNVGWRPTSEDTLPLIGKTSIPNLYIATGTKRDGLHCAPIISDAIATLMNQKVPDVDLSLFTPERMPVRIYTREEAIESTVRHIMNAAYQHDFVPAKNRMTEHLEAYYREDLVKLHDKVGAVDWGIPPEMIDMYRYGHIS